MSIFLKSILAGMMIALGGFVYITVNNQYIGAFLFSLGLLTIISKGYCLYTGKIYSLQLTYNDLDDKLSILVGNFIGSYFIIGGICRFIFNMNTDTMWALKTSRSYWTVFFLSVLCGVMMYLAVSLYKKEHNPLYVVMPIMFFILTGCEHCVANMFYMSLASCLQPSDIMFLWVNIIGNSIGSIVWYKFELLSNKGD